MRQFDRASLCKIALLYGLPSMTFSAPQSRVRKILGDKNIPIRSVKTFSLKYSCLYCFKCFGCGIRNGKADRFL